MNLIQYPTIYLEQKTHKKESQLLLKFSFDNTLIGLIKSIRGTHWSKTMNAWYLKNSEENLSLILELFKGVTKVDTSKVIKKTRFKRNLTDSTKKIVKCFLFILER